MSDLTMTREKPERQLWDVLEHVSAGMLGVAGSDEHMQPMAPLVDERNRSIWFFTGRNTDLAKMVAAPQRAHFCVIGPRHDYHACLSGMLRENMDAETRDRFWSSTAAAWFDGGKDDPNLTMLQLELDDAAIWASTRNPITFGWQIAKANLSGGSPDVGARAHVRFGSAAEVDDHHREHADGTNDTPARAGAGAGRERADDQ